MSIEKIPHYSLTNPASIYNEEALTVLELAARTAAKINEVVGDQNDLRETTTDHLKKQDADIENKTSAQDKKIDDAITRQDKEIDTATAAQDKKIADTLGSIPDLMSDALAAQIAAGNFDKKVFAVKSDVDMNTLQTTSLALVTGNYCQNTPDNIVPVLVDIQQYGGYITQTAVEMNGPFNMWYRVYKSGTWYPWQPVKKPYGVIDSDGDLNDLAKQERKYFCYGDVANAPESGNTGLVENETFRHDNGAIYTVQTWTGVYSGKIYHRIATNNTWGEWSQGGYEKTARTAIMDSGDLNNLNSRNEKLIVTAIPSREDITDDNCDGAEGITYDLYDGWTSDNGYSESMVEMWYSGLPNGDYNIGLVATIDGYETAYISVRYNDPENEVNEIVYDITDSDKDIFRLPFTVTDDTEHVIVEVYGQRLNSGVGTFHLHEFYLQEGVLNAPENGTGLLDVETYYSNPDGLCTLQVWRGWENGNEYHRHRFNNGTWQPWQMVTAGGKVHPLTGKTIVFLGDSVFANDRTATGVVAQFAKITGAKCYNFAFGGTRAEARTENANWAEFDGERLVFTIRRGDWNTLRDNLTSDMPSYFEGVIEEMAAFDWPSVDYVVWNWGTNDFTADVGLENYVNAIETGIAQGIPYGVSVRVTPLPRFDVPYLNTAPNTQYEFAAACHYDLSNPVKGTNLDDDYLYNECSCVPFQTVDVFTTCGFTNANKEIYLINGGAHLTPAGAERLAVLLAQKIC